MQQKLKNSNINETKSLFFEKMKKSINLYPASFGKKEGPNKKENE